MKQPISIGCIFNIFLPLLCRQIRCNSKKKAFSKSTQKWKDDLGKKEIDKDLSQVG